MNITQKNIFSSVLYQILYAVSGIIIPKLMLVYFGSEINGLINSLAKILCFYALAEGGMSSVLMTALYKPLVTNDEKYLNCVLSTANKFYKKIAWFFALFVLTAGFVYSIFISNKFDFFSVFILAILVSIPTFISFYHLFTIRTLVIADQKAYVVNFIGCVFVILNIILVYFSTVVFANIHITKLFSVVAFLVQPILMIIYVNKNYKIDIKKETWDGLLNQRWDGFTHNLANFIHNNIDVYILTLNKAFISISIYSIYEMIVVSLKNVIISISEALVPMVGNAFVNSDYEVIGKTIKKYEFIVYFVTTLIMSCGICLIEPFIVIYTKEITDAQYNNILFGIIFFIAEAIHCYKTVYVELSFAKGKFKDTKKYAILEMLVNLILSILLVKRFGIVGVALATLIAMIVRLVLQIIYVNNNIYNINVIRTLLLVSGSVGVIFLNYYIHDIIFTIYPSSYVFWLLEGIAMFILSLITTGLFYTLFFRNLFKEYVLTVIKRKV